MSCDPNLFIILKSLLEGISTTLGPMYEFVLHDFSDLERSIIAIKGNVTNRKPGSPGTNVLLSELRKPEPKDIIAYPISSDDGRVLRSSIIFLRDRDGKPFGAVGINMDCTELVGAQKAIGSLTAVQGPAEKEDFSNEVSQLVSRMIERAMALVPKVASLMTKEDRQQILKSLDEQGFFLIKGSIDAIAVGLGVSRATIYLDLDTARGNLAQALIDKSDA